MSKKIFGNMCLLIAITVLFTAAFTLFVTYDLFSDQVRESIQNEAEYISYFQEDPSFYSVLKRNNSKNRITIVGEDGTVIYDNQADAHTMENHLDRPEIAQALTGGSGNSVRLSETLQERTYYYALELNNGTVLRVAATTESVIKLFIRLLPLTIPGMLLIFIVALFLAKRLTKVIVDPINKIDIDDLKETYFYEELNPFIYKITAQKKQISYQMEQLKSQMNKMEAISQQMNEGLVILDEAGLVVSLNNSAAKLFQVSAESCVQKNYLYFTRDLKVLDGVRSALAGEKGNAIVLLNQNYYQFFYHPVLEKGTITGVILLFFDISEKERVERIRREFSANVSHELKTPLTTVFGYAQMINNKMVQEEDILRFTGKIEEEAKRLIQLIDSIMKLSKLDEQAYLTQLTQVSLMKLGQEVLKGLEGAIEKKGMLVKQEGEDCLVLGDPVLLSEMLYNIFENAVKYGNDEGKIHFRVSQEENFAKIEVQNTGMGIPKEDLDRIFERFYRVDKSHSRIVEGSGLGLSIVKHIALIHHGLVTANSVPGDHTTLTVKLPLYVENEI